jgi:hypothetical protein
MKDTPARIGEKAEACPGAILSVISAPGPSALTVLNATSCLERALTKEIDMDEPTSPQLTKIYKMWWCDVYDAYLSNPCTHDEEFCMWTKHVYAPHLFQAKSRRVRRDDERF